MKFIITRTSDWDTQPCENVVKETIMTKGWKQNCDKEVYFGEINTLDELIAFIDKQGKVVIQKNFINDDYYEIEIYDYWRE